MAKLQVIKALALTGLMTLSAVPLVTAQSLVPPSRLPQTQPNPNLPPIQPNLQLSQQGRRRFSCGPHLRTYVVRSFRSRRRGKGIRCVKFSPGSRRSRRTPRFAWYGEGNWNGGTYRHVGHAFYRNGRLLQGYASDIFGNGENAKNNFPGNLKVEIINPNKIRVTGAWDEEWIRVQTTRYKPLARPKRCGRYFDQYRVRDLVPLSRGGRRGRGLRCVLRVGPSGTYARGRYFTTWFGKGNWDGNRYSHLGTRSVQGPGASDICDKPFGPVCNTFAYGSLKISPVPGGYKVTNAWRERWY